MSTDLHRRSLHRADRRRRLDVGTPRRAGGGCIAAACRELQRVYGAPNSELDPDWLDDDPDLERVRVALTGKALPRELRESMRWLLG